MTALKQEIFDIIRNSEKVLVGIGEEFSLKEFSHESSPTFQLFKEKREKDQEREKVGWMLEVIENNYLNSEISMDDLSSYKAYKELLSVLDNKDYFIVNMNTDRLLEKIGFAEDKIVHPCGNNALYQCKNNCSDEVENAVEIDNKIIESIYDKQLLLSQVERPVCKKCGEILVYNSVKNRNYCEAGYLSQWEKYTEWTSRTLNKSLCVLELGVNFDYPTVIRWPFEKIAFINQKAHFIRINEKFNQISSELSNKGVSIKENAINFLAD